MYAIRSYYAEALAGKYIDYRVNRSVESIRFMLDRDGEHFYEAVTAPSHPQRDGDLLTFVFSQGVRVVGKQHQGRQAGGANSVARNNFV